jgi:putative ABC transport system substrate-binding protein
MSEKLVQVGMTSSYVGFMRRREFLGAIAGALAMRPVPAQSQSSTGVAHRVGILAQDLQPGLLETLRDEFLRLGYVEGRSIVLALRNAEGVNERLPTLAGELLRLNVKVIVAINTPAAQAAKRATSTVPVVMMRVADPEKSGLVNSLARPGGNIKGLSFMPDALGPKGVEVLREIMPRITRMAALFQGNNPGAVVIIDEVERKGAQLGLKFVRLPVEGVSQYSEAFKTASVAGSEALFVMDDGAITADRRQILDLATKHRLPVVSIYRDFAEAGGLIAYGPNLPLMYRRGAGYVDKILKGEPASSLPVEQPANFDLVINLKTAKALGLTLPQSVLVRANQIIE